ncbi:hypothetical protein SAMN05216238_11285 [Lentibacillus persicus]|uniref:Uncharacterized protein n=1 Tax=Lentibacillus persicus TaxID=640948 RepID=A0A1I1ZGI7_9BACI|nr:hypothetical protein SAMN05216238_11285 [Lentibacillus persicus]
MKNKTRVTLGIALYFLLCIFDYIISNTVKWTENILEAVISMVIIWLIIEFVPNHIEK